MRNFLAVALFGLVVLFTSGCGDSGSPEAVVKSFCNSDFAQSKQYIVPGKADAYEQKCREWHQTYKVKFDGSFPKSYFTGPVGKAKVNGTAAEVEVEYSKEMSLGFELKQIDGKWYISRVPVVPAFM